MVRDAPAVTLTGSPREVARAVAARLDDAARAGRPEAEGGLLHALRVSPQVDLILGELTLARISHRPVAAARDAPALAAFPRLRVLDGPPSPTPRPSGRKRHHHRHLPRFASRGGEICELA